MAENSDPQNGKQVGVGDNYRRLAMATAEGRRLELSPGDMTAVSAAPLTPFEPDSPERPRHGSSGAGDMASPTTLRQQRSSRDASTPGSVAKLSASASASAAQDDQDEDLFPVADDDDHHLGMGLHEDLDHSPPPPEDSAEDLIHNTSFEQEEAEREEAEADEKARARAKADDDDDSDGVDGVGFQLADQDDDDDDMPPPDSPPISTADDEEDVANAARKSKSKKKKGKVSSRDDDSASAEITPDDGKKKAKKKRRNKRVTYADRVANFSTPTGKSHGYPAGNRGYTVIPISDFKSAEDEADSDDDGNGNGGRRRRSRRKRVQPLAYWKNERLEYVAHGEEGSLADAMGDMAVVGGVVRANPTPYKERKAAPPKKKTRKGKRKGGDSDDDESTYAPRDVEPFDTKKLRKVSCGKEVIYIIFGLHAQ